MIVFRFPLPVVDPFHRLRYTHELLTHELLTFRAGMQVCDPFKLNQALHHGIKGKFHYTGKGWILAWCVRCEYYLLRSEGDKVNEEI